MSLNVHSSLSRIVVYLGHRFHISLSFLLSRVETALRPRRRVILSRSVRLKGTEVSRENDNATTVLSTEVIDTSRKPLEYAFLRFRAKDRPVKFDLNGQ